MDEQNAIQQLKNGDISGLEILVARYQVKAVRTAYLITFDHDLAQDIAQDAFVQVFRSIHAFDATRPFAAVLIAVLTLLIVSGAAYALGKTLGYFPGVGLVDNSTGIRILAQPVSLTRDGITLTLSSALIYADHADLAYEIPALTTPAAASPQATPAPFCDSAAIHNARLRLPDGTVLERDTTSTYPQNRFTTKPVFAAANARAILGLVSRN